VWLKLSYSVFEFSRTVKETLKVSLGLLMASVCYAAAALPSNKQACATKSDSPIMNFCVSTSNKLWRGAKPDTVGATWLVNQGVAAVVNLELLNDDLATLRSVKPDAALSTQINYFRVRDWEPLVKFAPHIVDRHVVEFLAVALNQPGPIYVHCRSGENRTGVMVAAYRVILEDWAIETAVSEMQQYKGIWFNSDARYIRSLTPARRAALLARAKSMAQSTKPRAVIACLNGRCQ
jgi:hypothetical protein